MVGWLRRILPLAVVLLHFKPVCWPVRLWSGAYSPCSWVSCFVITIRKHVALSHITLRIHATCLLLCLCWYFILTKLFRALEVALYETEFCCIVVADVGHIVWKKRNSMLGWVFPGTFWECGVIFMSFQWNWVKLKTEGEWYKNYMN